MKLNNALRKMRKYGKVYCSGGYLYTVEIGKNIVEVMANGPGTEEPILSVRVRNRKDRHDPQTDYWAGSIFKSLTAGLRWAARK